MSESQHESRQEEAIRHLAEAVKLLASGEPKAAEDAGKLAKHVLALVAVDETETDTP